MARQIELTTPLGPDVLLFRAMHGREELGRLSEFDLSAVSTQGDIKPGDILAKNVTLKLELLSGGPRYFNGYVTRFAQGGLVGRYYEYRMVVRSWLWFLTRTADCRIFQEKTVPEIIKEVFADHAVAVFEDDLTGTYAKREYCVQYRETDFNFVSRLMEEEGIYYYLEHGDGRHVLKLVDSYSGHKTLDNVATIPYYPPHRQSHADEEYIHAWTFAQSIQPGAAALVDYDHLKPKADLTVKAKLMEPHEHADYEVFDYPGEYVQIDDGEHFVRARIDELHAQFDRAQAECNVREIAFGRLFTLTNAPRRDQDREYLIVGAEYTLRDDAYEASGEEGATYACAFTAMPSRQQFRPARITPEPKVQGPQNALVVGPAGEEIWCDKYGRVKVQFYWDRYGKKDENSSCWIRVSHPWAGGTWGMVAIPRMGQEVLVDFLEGDPDRPIIVGRVYNADQMPPYALPANKTQTGTKTRSSKGGGAANFNEIRFEDKKGSEMVTIHAEKDQDISVENDESHSVGHDRTKTIDHDETTHVKHDRTETVDNNETITVHANRTETVDANETITVHANRTERVDANETISVGGNRTRTVSGNETVTVSLIRAHTVGINEAITVGAAQEVTVGAAQTITVGAVQAVTVGAAQRITVGASQSNTIGANRDVDVGGNQSHSVKANASMKVGGDEARNVDGGRSSSIGGDDNLKVGTVLVIDAGDSITLQTGSASITMEKDGTITIKGKDITITGSGEISGKADGNMTLKAQKILQN
ncbi:MAG TPA: type VI secretion system tip protein TssI/VgrG [Candidatus Methylomirabilis sp.]|nr:type VI secretion system tip protein TssI/VgrG [Candidatus Methylomirabilis sp.]